MPVKFIEAYFVLHPEQEHQAGRQPDSHPADVEQRVHAVAQQVADGDFQIIPEHVIRF